MWLIEGPQSYKAQQLVTVVAPYSYLAFRTASKELPPSAFRGSVDQVWLRSKMGEAVVLDQGVDGEGRTTLALTPATMAAMDDERHALHAITYVFAVATALERKECFSWI